MKTNIKESPLRKYSKIPSFWKPGQHIRLYDTASPEIHYADGWRDLVEPPITENQRRGAIIYDVQNELGTYEVIELTPEEIAIREQQKIDSDVSAQLIQQRESDGQELFRKFFIHIRRLLDKDQITPNQAKNSVSLLFDALLPITFGQFEFAQIRLNALAVPANAKEKMLLDEAKEKIAEYLK